MSDTVISTTTTPDKSHTGSVIAALGGVLITVLVTGALFGRAALSADTAPKIPLTVAVTVYEPGDSYLRQVSYLGLVSSGQKARLGFELTGQIDSLLVRPGSKVTQGEVIATLDDASLRSRRRATAADLTQAQAELELAQLKSRRQRSLADSGAVSKEAFDETRLRAQALQAQVQATEARLDGLDIQLAKTQLIAPYDGVIAEQYLHPGAVVSPGVAVVRLLQTGAREAHIGVAAARVSALEPGASYALTLRGEALQAELLSVRPDVDPRTRAATAIFALPANQDVLDGEPISLALPEEVDISGGWLPISALLEGRRGMWTVLKIQSRGDGYATVREAVEVLEVQGDRAYVRGTLGPGDRVVKDGTHRITAGNAVQLAGDS